MKYTLHQIASAAHKGGLDGEEVMSDLLRLSERNGGTPTLREYLLAHAPEHPQPWFQPVVADDTDAAEREKQRWVQWAGAWADEQLKLLAARMIG